MARKHHKPEEIVSRLLRCPSTPLSAAADGNGHLALRLKEIFPQLRRGRPEEIGGVTCETLIGTAPAP